jgi:hypothetical protein
VSRDHNGRLETPTVSIMDKLDAYIDMRILKMEMKKHLCDEDVLPQDYQNLCKAIEVLRKDLKTTITGGSILGGIF